MAEPTKLFIGVDIGTTGCRSVIYDDKGKLVSTAKAEYPLNTPHSGWAEQEPPVIFENFKKTLTDAVKANVSGSQNYQCLSFSSVFHGIFPVSESGEPLHAMLTWADSRAQPYMKDIADNVDNQALYERTGCPLHPMYPLLKILWFRKEQPQIFAKAHKFISIKEYLIHRLTGEFAVDRSIASGTGFFNHQINAWDPECLKILGLTAEKLSPVYPTTHILSKWSAPLASEVGLSPNIPLVLGAGDGVLSTLGSGAIGPGKYTAMIGTSGAVRLTSPTPRTDWKTKNWCYDLGGGLWVLGGAISNGGLALRWARDKFARTEQYVAEKLQLDIYDVLARYAEQKPPGSDGLIFLPFLAGERAPYWNANARGVLFGLNLNHGKRHLMRATFEGIIFCMYAVFRSLKDLMPEHAGIPIEVRTSGSFTRSPFWVQMMADVFGQQIVVPGEPEGSAFGAVVLGMFATKHIDSLEKVKSLGGIPKAIYSPNMENHQIYLKLFGIYERVYFSLLKEFDEISSLQIELENRTVKK